MKKIFVMITSVIILSSLSGCGSDNQQEIQSNASESTSAASESTADVISSFYTVDKENDNDNYLGAIVYLGYSENENAAEALLESAVSALSLDKSLLDENAYDVCATSGLEYYLIIPKYTDTKITVMNCELDDNANIIDTDKLTETSKPLIIKCNVSDILPDVSVIIEHNNKTDKFSPVISLKDGSVIASDCIYIYDYALTYDNRKLSL